MNRPLPLILFAYIAGIVIGNFFYFPSSWTLAAVGSASLALAGGLLFKKTKPALILAPLIFFLFGIFFIGRILYPDFPSHHLVHFPADRKFNIEGILYRAPEPDQGKTRLYVRAERIQEPRQQLPATGKILLTVKDAKTPFHYGDRVRFISKLYRPKAATNPGGFDYRRFLALRGIWVTAFANSTDDVVRMEEGQGNFFFHFIESGREKIRVFLDENAPAESRGVIKALILGERGEIPKELNEKFIVSGVSHILAISGLHVALVAGFFFALTRFLLKLSPYLLLRFELNKAAALVAVVPVIFYTFLAGLGLAAVRSTIMVLSFLLAVLLDRAKDLYDALFVAAFVILLASPAALFDISFQLSFLAVLAILYLIPRLREFIPPSQDWSSRLPEARPSPWKRKLVLYLGASLLTTAAAILGTGPVSAFYFNRISLVGFLANLVLVPLMGLGNTLLSLLTALFVFLLQPLAKALLALNVLILDVSLAMVDLFSRFPLASRRVTTPILTEILLLYGMIVFAANLKRWKRSVYGFALCAGIFVGLQMYWVYATSRPGELTVTFLDVGQGDSAVVRFPGGEVMVLDGGGSPEGSFDPGERIVAPYLWQAKRKRIDILTNSHPHPDHLQGLIFLLDHFEVGKVWENGERWAGSELQARFLKKAGERAETMGHGRSSREVDGVRLEFLHPPLQKNNRPFFFGNDTSLVIRLTYGEVSFLFTGDVKGAAEEEILSTGADLRSTIIKVPHHGSKSSSTTPFLARIRPKFAVFSARGGTRGLPNPHIVKRYESMGSKIFRTDRDGAISFVTDGKEIKVRTFLGEGKNEWPLLPVHQ